MRKPDFWICETKTQISFAVTAKLISAFVFATWIAQSLFFLNPKFPASSDLLSLHSPVYVAPGRKPRRPVFSQRGSIIWVMMLKNCTKNLHKYIDTLHRIQGHIWAMKCCDVQPDSLVSYDLRSVWKNNIWEGLFGQTWRNSTSWSNRTAQSETNSITESKAVHSCKG